MSIFVQNDLKTNAVPVSVAAPPVHTSIGENFIAAWRAGRNNDLTNSLQRARESAYQDRIDQIYEATGVRLFNPLQGEMQYPPELMRQIMADPAAAFDVGGPGGMMLPSSGAAVEYFEKRVEDLTQGMDPGAAKALGPAAMVSAMRAHAVGLEEHAAEVGAHGGWLGAAAQLVGRLAAGFTDPINVVASPAGATARTLGGAVLRESLLNMGLTAVVTPEMQETRAVLGLEQTDPVTDVAMSGLIGGAFGGAVHGVVHGAPALLKRFRAAVPEEMRTPEQREAVAQLENEIGLAAQNPFVPYLPPQRGNPRDSTALSRPGFAGEASGRPAVPDLSPPSGGPRASTALSRADFLPEPSRLAVVIHQREFDRAAQALAEDAPLRTADGAPSLPPSTLPVRDAPPAVDGLSVFDPSALEVDAKRFQFKAGGDEAGVTDRLQGVEAWDPTKAGLTLVFEQEDGRLFIADGHQRLGLARRLQAEGQDARITAHVLREADGYTAEDARAIAAAKNIAEGSGTAVDAAKVLRDAPGVELNLPPRSALVRQAQALRDLSDDAFYLVVNERVPADHAAIASRLVADPELHVPVLEMLAQARPENQVQAEAIVRQALAAGFHEDVQSSLFGDELVRRALLKERAQVADRALRELKGDRATFKRLADEAARIEAVAGNRLNAGANRARESIDAQAIHIFNQLANRRGGVSDALNAAARRVADGESPGVVARDVVDALRDAIAAGDLDGLSVGDAGGAPRPRGENPPGIERRLDRFDDPSQPPDDADLAGIQSQFDAIDETAELPLDDGSTVTRAQLLEEFADDEQFLLDVEECLS